MIVSNVASVKLVLQLDGELSDPAIRAVIGQVKVEVKKEISIEKLCFLIFGWGSAFQ
ncbi:MAG: hypothetical protein MZU84_05055 [Sphingobacterium sp.]|nr:hypothetical protein [Sphingobacterium sp.]